MTCAYFSNSDLATYVLKLPLSPSLYPSRSTSLYPSLSPSLSSSLSPSLSPSLSLFVSLYLSHTVSVGSPVEPKQLAIDSQEDSADMQERLLAIVMEVVGVFLWTSVLEGSHREVGKIDAQFTAHAATVNVLLYI